MDAGQFWALLTVVSLVGLFLASAGMADDYRVGEICAIFQKVFGVLLLVALVACVWIASGISLSIST